MNCIHTGAYGFIEFHRRWITADLFEDNGSIFAKWSGYTTVSPETMAYHFTLGECVADWGSAQQKFRLIICRQENTMYYPDGRYVISKDHAPSVYKMMSMVSREAIDKTFSWFSAPIDLDIIQINWLIGKMTDSEVLSVALGNGPSLGRDMDRFLTEFRDSF